MIFINTYIMNKLKITIYRSNKINKWHVPNMQTRYRSKTVNYKFDINKYKLVRELDLETLIEYYYDTSIVTPGVFRPYITYTTATTAI